MSKFLPAGMLLFLSIFALECGGQGRGSEAAVAGASQASNPSPGFTVDFTDCIESIGVGLVPTANARALVPAEYVLAGDGGAATPIVVRTSRCGGIAVDGHKARAGSIVQVGAVIVPPDFTGDINSYTFWYYTSNDGLAFRLRSVGVNAQLVDIDYDYRPDVNRYHNPNAFHVEVPWPGDPRFSLSGTVDPSTAPSGSFDANWWKSAVGGDSVKMETHVPVIDIGGADLTVSTKANSSLGQLLGGASAEFPLLQQFNQFHNAQMQVTPH